MRTVLYYGSSTQVHSGACQWMFRLSKEMRNRGWSTTAILPNRDGIAEWYDQAGLDYRILWSEPFRRRRSVPGQILYLLFVLFTSFKLAVLIRRSNVDVVHVNEIRYAPMLLGARLGGARTVCHVRACFESRLLRRVLGRWVVLLAHAVICVSERSREQMFHEVGIRSDVITVLHDAVPSPERFETLPPANLFRDKLDIGSEVPLVLSISKLTHNKGQDRLLKVAELFEKSEEDIEFAIIGGEVTGHGTYADEIRHRGQELETVHVTGFYPNIPEALSAADILVHVPRHDDPFPGVVMEGMLAGVPVIGSRSGGIPEQIEHGETGFLVDKDASPAEIADSISKLTLDANRRREMGRQAAIQIRERFPVEPYLRAIDDIYCSLLPE